MSACTLAIIIKSPSSFIDAVNTSIVCQSCAPTDVIFVADSAPADLVREFERRCGSLPVPARVVWTHDQRSSDSRERNALRAALHAGSSPYIIVSDSTAILHRRFVEMHLALSRPSFILTAPRVMLSPRLSDNISDDDIRNGWPRGHRMQLLLDGVFGGTSMVSHAPLVTSPILRLLLQRRAADVFGGNFSLCREDAEHLLRFVDSNERPDANSLYAAYGIRIRYERNAFVQYECRESSTYTLVRQPGVLRRVQRLQVAVRDTGLRPAMHSHSAKSS